MSHKDDILEAFARNGYTMKLGYILQHPWGYEFRARLTELRHAGLVINCLKGKTPSDNEYRLVYWDKTGQGQLL